MNLRAHIAVLSVILGVACSSETIEYEDRIDTIDTNKEDEDRSIESFSGESVVSARPTRYNWVPQTKKFKQMLNTPAPVSSSAEVTTALNELKNNLSDHFEKPPLNDFKFAVSIQRKGAHYATGALIDSKWVLTSAKEFFNVRESIKLFRLRIGTINCKQNGILVPIKEILIHPSYKFGDVSNDVALLRLAAPAEDSEDIEPISLALYKACNKFVTCYWPRVFVNNILLPASAPEREKHTHLRVSTQSLIPWKECFKWMAKRNITLHESTLCLKPIRIRHSKCLPDAGAPVLSSDGLWGVTSSWRTYDCHHKPSPTLVTRISSPHINSWVKKWTSSSLWNPGATDI